jgi:hypothetical protein
MALILRVDIDKPYGNSTIFTKVASKIVEDYFDIPIIGSWNYLYHHIAFLKYCNAEKIPGFMYHRHCTAPNAEVARLTREGGHKLCFHAENTRNLETFTAELDLFKKKVTPDRVDSFSKHGSGQLKLGKHHYPPYEPEKYREWGVKTNTAYYFGNTIGVSAKALEGTGQYFDSVFWVERDYRDPAFSELEQVLEAANHIDIAILIHPCNYHANKTVAADFKELVRLSKERAIPWRVF